MPTSPSPLGHLHVNYPPFRVARALLVGIVHLGTIFFWLKVTFPKTSVVIFKSTSRSRFSVGVTFANRRILTFKHNNYTKYII